MVRYKLLCSWGATVIVALFCISCSSISITYPKRHEPPVVVEEVIEVEEPVQETVEEVVEPPVEEEIPTSYGKLLWDFSAPIGRLISATESHVKEEPKEEPAPEEPEAGMWDIDLERDGKLLVVIMAFVTAITVIGGWVGTARSRRND